MEKEDGNEALDLAAGFDEDDPTAATQQEPSEEVEQEATPEPVEAVEESPKLATITEAQFQELLAKVAKVEQIEANVQKSFAKAFGVTGSLEQRLNALQQGGEVTEEDAAELRAEFPEFADRTVSMFNKALKRMRVVTPAPAVGADGQPVLSEAEQVEAARKQIELDYLAEEVPDWLQVVHSPEFSAWKGTKKQAFQTKLNASMDGEFIARQIARFRDETKPPPEVAPTPAVPARPNPQKARIAAAVTPRGDGGHATSRTSQDDVLAGFNEDD